MFVLAGEFLNQDLYRLRTLLQQFPVDQAQGLDLPLQVLHSEEELRVFSL